MQADPNCDNGIDDDGNGYVDDCWGYNFADDTGGRRLAGEGWHGTHVAGIVAADTDNGVGVAGTKQLWSSGISEKKIAQHLSSGINEKQKIQLWSS